MCGIAGFSGRYPVDETKMRWLIAMNENRGSQSTGVFTISSDKNKTETLLKTVDRAERFVLLPEARDAIRGAMSVVAHTRAATWGAVSKDNAHPFMFGEKDNMKKETRVVGVHNGFVIQELIKKCGFEKTFDVDSMLIFAYLSKNGGDYKALKEIEGGVTIAYMVPDKYPDVIHLYRRQARNLHFGYAKEGIYFSSEDFPLKMIGCQNVLQIPDLTLLALRNGELIDSIDCEPPMIKSLPLDAKRHDWKDKAPKEEYEKYPELKEATKTYSKVGKQYHGQGTTQIGFRPNPVSYEEHFTNHLDLIGSLVKEVVEDTKFITDKAPLRYLEQKSYENGDIECCMLLVKLCNSAHKNDGLPGFLLFDKADPTICGVTAPNGITVLKYSVDKCGKPRTLITADPVDGDSKWEITVEPEKGRVMEVALQLPFPQEAGKQTASSGNSDAEKSRSYVAELGATQLYLLPPPLNKGGDFSSGEEVNTETICETKIPILKRLEEEHVSGMQEGEIGRENTGSVLPTFESSEGIGTTRTKGVCELVPNTLSKSGINLILGGDRGAIEAQAAIRANMSTMEFHKLSRLLEDKVGPILVVKRLIEDASWLKSESKRTYGNSFSLGVYAMRLIEVLPEKYYCTGIVVTMLDKLALDKFRQDYLKGQFMKKEDVQDQIKKKVDPPTIKVGKGGLDAFLIGRWGLIPILEFMAHKKYFLQEMPMYTTEKKLALLNVVSLHNSQIRQTLADVEEVRHTFAANNYMGNQKLLGNLDRIKDTLGNLRDRNDEFLDQLKKELPHSG